MSDIHRSRGRRDSQPPDGQKAARSRHIQRIYGPRHIVSGVLLEDPRVYTRRDGSRKYMFCMRVDTPGADSGEKPTLCAERFVPSWEVTATPYAAFRRNDRVRVDYDACLDLYYDAGGKRRSIRLNNIRTLSRVPDGVC